MWTLDGLLKYPILLLVVAVVWFLAVLGVIAGIAWLGMLVLSACLDCLAKRLGSAKIAFLARGLKEAFRD